MNVPITHSAPDSRKKISQTLLTTAELGPNFSGHRSEFERAKTLAANERYGVLKKDWGSTYRARELSLLLLPRTPEVYTSGQSLTGSVGVLPPLPAGEPPRTCRRVVDDLRPQPPVWALEVL